VELTLFVECEDGDIEAFAEVVDFFLHDTFNPSRIRSTFRRRTAQITLLSHWGFTVGAWLPRRKIELELDLAKVPGAPQQIIHF
jgi:hypothetical protein